MGWYRTGTVDVTTGSVDVYGTDTLFLSQVRDGQTFIGPDGIFYEIQTVVSDTHLQLHFSKPYAGGTATGQGYSVIRTGERLTSTDLLTNLSSHVEYHKRLLDDQNAWHSQLGTISVYNPHDGSTVDVKTWPQIELEMIQHGIDMDAGAFAFGEQSYRYWDRFRSDNTQIGNWYNVVEVTLGNGGYKGCSIDIDVSDGESTYGRTADLTRDRYTIALVRSMAVEDDTQKAYISGTRAGVFRVEQTAANTYLIQFSPRSNYRQYNIDYHVTAESGATVNWLKASDYILAPGTGTIFDTLNDENGTPAFTYDAFGDLHSVNNISADGIILEQGNRVWTDATLDVNQYLRSDQADTFTDLTGSTLRLTSGSDVGLGSSLHAFQIGQSTGLNLAVDNNEIQARNNGAAGTLYLNAGGGEVRVGSSRVVTETSGLAYDSDRLDGLQATQFLRADVASMASAHTTWADGYNLYLGTSGDMFLTHDGANSKIVVDTGQFQLLNRDNGQAIVLNVANSSGTDVSGIRIDGTGEHVLLYQGDVERFRTTPTGTTTTGSAYVTGDVNTDGTVNVNGNEVYHPGNYANYMRGSTGSAANFQVTDFDIKFGFADQASRGDSGLSRALVKQSGLLHINYNSDFGDLHLNGSSLVRVSAPELQVGTTKVADSAGVLYYGGIDINDLYTSIAGDETIGGIYNFTKGIVLANLEGDTGSTSVGTLKYDANYNITDNYLSGTGDPFDLFPTDGGGLVFRGEDGWAAVLDTQNMKWANVTFESVKVGSDTVITSGSYDQAIEGRLTIGSATPIDLTNTGVDDLVIAGGMYVHSSGSSYIGFASANQFDARFVFDVATTTLDLQARTGSATMKVNGDELIHSGGSQTIYGWLGLEHATSPGVHITETSGSANNKEWRVTATLGELKFQAVDDSGVGGDDYAAFGRLGNDITNFVMKNAGASVVDLDARNGFFWFDGVTGFNGAIEAYGQTLTAGTVVAEDKVTIGQVELVYNTSDNSLDIMAL